ncbi:MAG: SDR family oxidoreductase [Acidimicrobiia bacterium]|nr:SDR family oxidoreductase [Acidimicrobiia bacterium]
MGRRLATLADMGWPVSRVLVTGHEGYIGCVLVPQLVAAGHEVVGLDSGLFRSCTIGPPAPVVPSITKDVRDVEASDLEGFDAICHLAGLSNDPLGDLDPSLTAAINHRASVRLAEIAAGVGVERFVFSSSCSIYGSSPGGIVDETAPINPVTPYGFSKIHAEEGISAFASDDFSPIHLRNATAYGFSHRLRADLVINNLVGYALTQGRVFMKSDGTPWRPLIHIQDIARAFVAVLAAPRERVHNEVFNVGLTDENYQIATVASIVEQVVPSASIELAETAGPDIRDYRVDCGKIASEVPEFRPTWTVEAGARELATEYQSNGLTEDGFLGRLMRIAHLKSGLAAGKISSELRPES